jgi:hypothetical protein
MAVPRTIAAAMADFGGKKQKVEKSKISCQTPFNKYLLSKFFLETYTIYCVLGMHFQPQKKFSAF